MAEADRVVIAGSVANAPTISVAVPVHKVALDLFRETVGSVLGQTYPNWELCIADDASGDPELTAYLAQLQREDTRIKVCALESGRGISGATNAALELATGEFVAFLDHDDVLDPHALGAVAAAIERIPDVDLIYTDEDKLSMSGQREDPYFKPDWSPDLLLSNMYLGHLLVIRRDLVTGVGGLRSEFDGSQDYDLALRVTEQARKIHHIPEVLYHWRKVPGSTADEYANKPYAHDAARRALEATIDRRAISATVEDGLDFASFRVRYQVRPYAGLSIIILARDNVSDLDRCIRSLQRTVDLSKSEIIVIDDAAGERAGMQEQLRRLATRRNVRLLCASGERNESCLYNGTLQQCAGDVLMFLSGHVQAKAPGWAEAMLEHALRPEVGAVGCRLLYPDRARRVWHAGVVLGLKGIAGHPLRGHRVHESTQYGPSRVTNYSAVTGACMMLRRDIFELVGGFDDNFTSAFGDIDLCLRVQQRGLWIVYTPFATLVHHEPPDATMSRLREGESNQMRERWGRLMEADPFLNPHLPRNVENFVPLLRGNYWLNLAHPTDPPTEIAPNNPWWALPGIGLNVLWYEGPTVLARDAVRFFRERLRPTASDGEQQSSNAPHESR